MKTSARGLQFFSHKSRGPCQSAPETEAHLALKTLAAHAAQRAGWTCETEVSGSSPSGETWTADVLAYKGQSKIAIEIQWSGQTNEESRYRQERYNQSDVRCLWLLRRRDIPASEDFPAVRISGDIATGFKAHPCEEVMPLDEFLDTVFARRFRYGIPLGSKAEEAIVRVHSTGIVCRNCGVVTQIVTFIEVFVDPHPFVLTVSGLNGLGNGDPHDFQDLLALCLDRIPKGSGISVIKPRYSKTHEPNYMSNFCSDCDALIDDVRHSSSNEHAILAEFQIRISERWVEAIEAFDRYRERGWGVFAVDALSRRARPSTEA
jgi:hypothetical protein